MALFTLPTSSTVPAAALPISSSASRIDSSIAPLSPPPATTPVAAATTPTLADKAVVANLTIGMWDARRTDRDVTQEVATIKGSDKEMGTFTKRLLSRESLARVRAAYTAARLEHTRRTLPWLNNGAGRILKNSGYTDYVGVLTDYQTQFYAAVEEFLTDYQTHIREAQGRLGAMFRSEEYPTVNQLRSKYYFTLEYFGVPTASDFRANLSASEVERIKADIERATSAKLAAAQRDVAERIKEVVGHMAERLSSYDASDPSARLFDSTVGNVADLARLLPTLNLTDDPELAAIESKMRDLCKFSSGTLKVSGASRAKTAAAAADLVKQMESFL